MPKVSIIIPTYNWSHMLGNAIQSVLGQTFQDFEIIVVDDGSIDNTQELVNRFYKKNEAGNVYISEESIERSKRKAIRNLLINCKYLHKNRIALILNL